MFGHDALPYSENNDTLAHQPWWIWRQWVVANSVGELLGLGISAAIGLGVVALLSWWLGTLSPVLFALIIVMAGVIEGAIVGVAQWTVLRQRLPDLPRTQWVRATAAGAFIAWALGMLPGTLIDMGSMGGSTEEFSLPPGVEYLLAALMGAVLGPILGGVQWWVLRAYVQQAWQWIPAHALAWAGGMTAIFVVMGLLPPTIDPSWMVVAFALAGIVAGAVVGAIHGVVVARFVPK